MNTSEKAACAARAPTPRLMPPSPAARRAPAPGRGRGLHDRRLAALQQRAQRAGVAHLHRHLRPAQDVAFSGDGARLVIVEEAHNEEEARLRARVLDSETLQPVSPILEFEGFWDRVHLNPTGTRLLTPGQVLYHLPVYSATVPLADTP